MKIYADALEEWVDMIGENWEAPDDLFLDPIEWIKGNKTYTGQSASVNTIFSSSFDKTEMFTERFREILQMCWINQKADLSIVVHERLKNATDSLQHVINLFLCQDELFSTGIPTSANLGLMKLDSKKVSSTARSKSTTVNAKARANHTHHNQGKTRRSRQVAYRLNS